MKNYPPYKIFLSFVLVFLCVALFFVLIPREKYLGEILFPGDSIDGDGVFKGRTHRPPEISGIIDHPADEPVAGFDQIHPVENSIFPDFVSQGGIEYPGGDTSILNTFIESVKSIALQGGQTRILYYGDSQLEGDRITNFVRRRLQQEYGGSEPGMESILESPIGILVDNFANRGSAGLEFTNDTSGFLKEKTIALDPDLIVLQYGINVVPAKTADFGYYGRYLKKEILLIQDLIPNVPILIVGVSDMGHLIKGIPRAYPSVAKVNAVQREAAGQTGSAFFDLLTFMGGPGSFQTWMDADPALIRQDFTHFSHEGGAIVGRGIAQALIEVVEESSKIEENGF